MAKKPTEQSVILSLGPRKQTGKKPKKPANLTGRLDDLKRECESWLRKLREVWCDPGDPMIEYARGSTELDTDILNHYDDAIEVMQWAEASAKYAVKVLQKGKQMAAKNLEDVNKL